MDPALARSAAPALTPLSGPDGWLTRLSWMGTFDVSAALCGGLIGALTITVAAWSAWQGLRVAVFRLRP